MISGTLPPGVRADEWILSYTALGKVLSPPPPSAADMVVRRLIQETALLVPVRVLPGSTRRLPRRVNVLQELDRFARKRSSGAGEKPCDARRLGRHRQRICRDASWES